MRMGTLQPDTAGGVIVEIPELVVREDPNDVSAQIRVQRIENGFLVRAGKTPIFYSSIEEAADAVKASLIRGFWELERDNNVVNHK